jgi:hypothetical protein
MEKDEDVRTPFGMIDDDGRSAGSSGTKRVEGRYRQEVLEVLRGLSER